MSSKSVWSQASFSVDFYESLDRDDPFDWNCTLDCGPNSTDPSPDAFSGSESPLDGFPYPSRYGWTRIAVVSVLVTVVMLAIVVGNGLVVMAIVVDRKLKSVQNWFVASLAVSDLFVGLFIMPLSLTNELLGYWAFGNVLCELWLSTDVLLCTASILNLCLISLDRYWSITCAVSYVRQRTRCRALAMISTVWVLSMTICLPPLVGWKRPQPTRYGYPLCVLSEEPGYVVYSIVGSFYLPLAVMVSVYFKIYLAARSRARRNLEKSDLMVTQVAAAGRNNQTRFKSSACYNENKRLVDSPTPEAAPHHPYGARSVFALSGYRGGEKRENNCCHGASSLLLLPASERNGNCLEMTPPTVQGTGRRTSPDANNGCAAAAEKETDFNSTNKKKMKFRNNDNMKMETRPTETQSDSVVSSEESTELENRRVTAAATPRSDVAYSTAEEDGLCSVVDSPPMTLRPPPPPPPPPFRQASHLSDSVGTSSADERTALFPISPPPTDNKQQTRSSSVCSRQYLKRYYFKYPTPSTEMLEATKAKRKLARARERRATLVLGIVMASFIGCWLPFFSIYPVTSFTGLEVPSEIFGVIFWLGYCNSALNPIIYTIFNREFRQAFHKILFRHLPGRSWV